MIRVCFFASLREQLGCESLNLPAEAAGNLAAVREYLMASYPDWALALQVNNILMAVNQQMARPDTPVADGDEVAFFPPVTGG